MGKIVFTLLLLALPVFSKASVLENLNFVGSGSMKWLFVNLYNAELYSADKANPKHFPLALKITYQRDIKASHLVKATQKEWQRLEINETKTQKWSDNLSELWPDITKNDNLIFSVDKSGEGVFLHNGNKLGAISDPEFSRKFLDIWLSENTREPKLRKSLLGIDTK